MATECWSCKYGTDKMCLAGKLPNNNCPSYQPKTMSTTSFSLNGCFILMMSIMVFIGVPSVGITIIGLTMKEGDIKTSIIIGIITFLIVATYVGLLILLNKKSKKK